MAKNKFGKFIAFTAVLGAAVAAGTAFFMNQKKKQASYNLDDDDFDDDLDNEDFDFPTSEPEENVQREYVSLNRETSKKAEEQTTVEEPVATVLEHTDEVVAENTSGEPSEKVE